MTTVSIVVLITQHFIFDWILQPRWVAINKSHNLLALLFHAFIITFGFITASACVYSINQAVIVAAIYGILHGAQDHIVWSTFKPKTENPYDEKQFWNRIAIDQLMHLLVGIGLLNLNL
ncbi:MAG: DUF3307 domain-containing protein [Candidatus Cloacimonetes bacterium]|jgi:thiol:disulfide interchange protein|nr:DUF3307 domain-containing protein [Candidatus Cloacimonadota bacterium]